VRRPRNVSGNPIGLLGPGRKIWAWFALDCGTALFKFRGRLVGVPTSIFEELVTLEFIARPLDVVAQKNALADTLRVLPFYDELVIDEQRRTDPEVVLEGYSAIWHYDRETHVLTVSDEISGEDGLVEFDGASEDGKVFWDGLGLTLSSGPLSRVDLTAEFNWTQQAYGFVDLTKYITSNWPQDFGTAGVITSFSLTADQWPKTGTNLGEGWEVAEANASEVYDLTVQTQVQDNEVNVNWSGGGTTKVKFSASKSYLNVTPPGSIEYPEITTHYDSQVTYARDELGSYASSFSSSITVVPAVLPLHHIRPTLQATYTAARPCTEVVSLSLFADVQHVLTDPEDGEALRIDDIRSVNLSEAIGDTIPIGDPRRRSFITTARGNQSLEHLIALARAHLLKRSRVVEITFAPKLVRMPEITLRKNAFLIEPRVGEALGKIVGYTLALDGSDGQIKCEVKIGCTVGRGGSAVAAGGEPTYAEEAYTGADYQQFTGRIVLLDTSVGYEPPNANPNDDGINFMAPISAEDVIDIPLAVQYPATEQREFIEAEALVGWQEIPSYAKYNMPDPIAVSDEERQESLKARSDAINNALKQVETRATFKLKNMSVEFSTPYQLQATDLKVPTGYDLEAV
jgi:hypothetical protein